MIERKIKVLFVVAFFMMIAIPLGTTNLQNNKISESENRILAAFPKWKNEEGKLNQAFHQEFETWINDNIGLRSAFVLQNAKILYTVFDTLADNSDYALGPNGEFNYAIDTVIRSYQHLDLKDQEALQREAESYQLASDYMASRGIQMYYFQCWDKQSIYPEYFPTTILQHGDISKTDQIVQNLRENTDIVVVSPKDELIAGKDNYATYSKWGDSTHWTYRGAYIGYQKLMKALNEKNQDKYRVLGEEDYNIEILDGGKSVFGGIHKEDYFEFFTMKDPKAILTNEKLSLFAEDVRHQFYTNEQVDNRDRVLVLGDSYFQEYLMDDLAESFFETIIIWGDYTESLREIIDTYSPNIIIVENAERCDRTDIFVAATQELLN